MRSVPAYGQVVLERATLFIAFTNGFRVCVELVPSTLSAVSCARTYNFTTLIERVERLRSSHVLPWPFRIPSADVVWPNALKRLAFGWHFNQSLQGATWPEGLEEISFGCAFNSPVDEVGCLRVLGACHCDNCVISTFCLSLSLLLLLLFFFLVLFCGCSCLCCFCLSSLSQPSPRSSRV